MSHTAVIQHMKSANRAERKGSLYRTAWHQYLLTWNCYVKRKISQFASPLVLRPFCWELRGESQLHRCCASFTENVDVGACATFSFLTALNSKANTKTDKWKKNVSLTCHCLSSDLQIPAVRSHVNNANPNVSPKALQELCNAISSQAQSDRWWKASTASEYMPSQYKPIWMQNEK